jgi:uncharacterized repeat protein (TIGR01451 family)
MALRNVAKACLVLVALFALTSLVVIGPPSLLQAQADEPPKQTSLETLPEPYKAIPTVPLELRRKIDPRVLKQFTEAAPAGLDEFAVGGPDDLVKRSPQVRYIVRLKPKADLTPPAQVAELQERRQAVVRALRQTAQHSQAALLTYLGAQQASGKVTSFTSYWVFNGLAITSDLEILLAVAARPEVESVREDRVYHLPTPAKAKPSVAQGGMQGETLTSDAAPLSLESIEWNIATIGADRVWNAYGLRGAGIVVAHLDSGVDWTHPALRRQYRGYDPADPAQPQHDYNWFDATDAYPLAPDDGEGHGTHTMGIMVGALPDGRNQVGVAPEARWISAKVFDDEGDAYESWIHAGFQWILAPTDLNGQNPNPALAPDICSNSWGDSDSSDITFWDDLHALRAAGIFAVFAAGNEDLGRLVVNSPGSFPHALAVGATDQNDAVTAWSCRGPSPWDEIKPEVTAPGANVRSTVPDNQYEAWDGTSMATPHVAGTVALLWQADRQYGAATAWNGPRLTITATEQIITSTAHPLPDAASVPNNDYGWGRVDAYQAVGSVAQGGAFWGRVTDAATGDAIDGATITMVNQRFGGSAQTWTDSQGYYTFSVAAGIYDVTAEQFYYALQSAAGVEIAADSTTQLDFRLTALPAGSISGRVIEAGTGQPVSATLRNIQRSAEVTTDVLGFYTMTLPVGQHVLEAVPSRAGHKIAQVVVTIVSQGQNVQRDFELEVIPKVLLVDADAWFTVGHIEYYQRSLETLLYSYDLWVVDNRSLFGIGNSPPTTTLSNYDVVVWAQPLSSPGYIGAWPDLSDYLRSGKALLLAGQDIGYWDVEREYGLDEYEGYLHTRYVRDDSGIKDIVGAGGAFLEGVSFRLDAPESAANQDAPSEIAPLDTMAFGVLDYVNDGQAGVAADDCRGFRVVYLAFGLEGVGPGAARTEIMQRSIEWLAESRPDYAFSLITPSSRAAGTPGGEAVLDFSLANRGVQADSYVLTVEGNRWPATVWDSTRTRQITTTAVVSACSPANLVLRVQIPVAAVTGDTGTLTLRAQSSTVLALSQERSIDVTAAMPWRALPILPTPRYGLAAAATGDCQFFVIGGWDADNEASRTNEMYDLRTGTWRGMAPKLTAAADTAAAAIGGKIYVPGGMRGQARLSVLEIFDPAANRWTQGGDLPHAAAEMAVAAAGGKLYAFGGTASGGVVLSSNLEYDPITQSWTERAPMPSGPREAASAAELGGKIYVAGGWPALRTFEGYDPTTDSWMSLAPMPTGRQSPSLVAADGYLYAIGGGNGFEGLPTVERYDPAADSWVAMPSLASPQRAGTSAVYVAGRLFVAGGIDFQRGIAAAHETLAVGTTLGGSGVVAPTTVEAGGELTYVITLRNTGSQAIPQAVLHDDIPAQTTYVPGSLVGDATYDAAANRIEWQGAMAPRSSKDLSFRVVVDEHLTRGTVITNTAVVDDGLCGVQTMLASTTVEAPDLSRSHKAVDKPIASSGDELSYFIELKNVGAVTATQVSLIDPIPPQLTYLPGSVEGATYNADLNQIEWSGVLPPSIEGGYRWADSDTGNVAYEWLDATDGGTGVPGGDDEWSGPFEIGFPFTFYGAEHTEFYLNTNGQVLFDSGSSDYFNVSIPKSDAPNNFIAPFWDDLVSEEGTMHYKLLGDAPDRQLVIEWAGVHHYRVEDSLTFEVILYEGSNQILIQYHALRGSSAVGESATVGIENAEGMEGVQYLYDGEGPGYPLHAGLAVLFEPVVAHVIEFRARIASDVPLRTEIHNEALLTVGDAPSIPLTVTTRLDWVDLPFSHKVVDKPLAVGGDELSYLIELRNLAGVGATNAALVDPIPPHLTYVPGSVAGAIYNTELNRIEWTGILAAGAEGSYRWADSDTGTVTYDWVDTIDGGTSVPGGDDAALGPFDIGFPFTFYGADYTEFYLNTNGQVLFGSGSSSLVNVAIPRADAPNNFIAPFWDDLVAGEGTMYYRLLGSAPNRRLAIEWAGVTRFGSTDPLTFEVILHEGSNQIMIQYKSLAGPSGAGESATVGIEDAGGTQGVEYLYNGRGPGDPLHAGLAILFEPATGQRITFRARVAQDAPFNTLVTNEALLTVGQQPPFPLTTTTWVNRIDLSDSDLAVNETQARPGGRLVYQIVLKNSGNVDASDASLIDPIPVGASYVAGSVSGGATYNHLENRIEWQGAVPVGGSVPLSFTVATLPDALHDTRITNTASFYDGVGNVVTKTVVTVLQTHDLSASDKTMPGHARPGEVITCTIRLRNVGVISTAGVLTDVIPTGATLIPASLWWSSGQGVVDAETVTWHGEIVPQGMVMVRFQMQLGEDVQLGTALRNTALIQDEAGHVVERSASTMVVSLLNPLYLPIIVVGGTP